MIGSRRVRQGSVHDAEALSLEALRLFFERGRGAGLPGSRYSRISIAAASRSRSRYGSPLTSTATRRIVPPVNAHGSAPG